MGETPTTAAETPDERPLAGRLAAGIASLGLAASRSQQARLLDFLELLARWNRAFNLTAVKDPAEMLPRHLLDSLSVHPYLCGGSVLDIGTGAGLPGIPLAILSPERRFWLLDGNGKKIRFVRQAVLALGLGNVESVQARIETYRPGRKFSTIVSRAVAAGDILQTGVADLLARPGRLLLMKGRETDADLGASGLSSGGAVTHRLTVPFLDVSRHLIEIRSD